MNICSNLSFKLCMKGQFWVTKYIEPQRPKTISEIGKVTSLDLIFKTDQLQKPTQHNKPQWSFGHHRTNWTNGHTDYGP